jgi:hypothetical protein
MDREIVRLRLRGMTPTQIAQEIGQPRLEVIAAMDRLKLTRKSKDRPIQTTADYDVVRSPSPVRQFSWQV